MLLPVLQRTPGSRLVLQSSGLHRACPSSSTFTSLDEINSDLGATNLYNRTKLAQILFVRALVRRMENNEPGFQSKKQIGPWINATHPGGVSTDQQEQAEDAYGTLGKIGVAAVRPLLKDPVDGGCKPALFAATSDAVPQDKIQGQYASSPPFYPVRMPKTFADAIKRSSLIGRSPSHQSKHRTWLLERTCGN